MQRIKILEIPKNELFLYVSSRLWHSLKDKKPVRELDDVAFGSLLQLYLLCDKSSKISVNQFYKILTNHINDETDKKK